MSDRLKFRVWDKYFNRYWTDEEVKNNIQWLLYPNNENIENVVIEQCMELRDKNGKLVYEGDIIKSTIYTVNMKVVYCVEETFFGLKYSHNDDNRCSAAMPSSEEIEIIGNIHENPEFLDADKA